MYPYSLDRSIKDAVARRRLKSEKLAQLADRRDDVHKVYMVGEDGTAEVESSESTVELEDSALADVSEVAAQLEEAIASEELDPDGIDGEPLQELVSETETGLSDEVAAEAVEEPEVFSVDNIDFGAVAAEADNDATEPPAEQTDLPDEAQAPVDEEAEMSAVRDMNDAIFASGAEAFTSGPDDSVPVEESMGPAADERLSESSNDERPPDYFASIEVDEGTKEIVEKEISENATADSGVEEIDVEALPEELESSEPEVLEAAAPSEDNFTIEPFASDDLDSSVSDSEVEAPSMEDIAASFGVGDENVPEPASDLSEESRVDEEPSLQDDSNSAVKFQPDESVEETLESKRGSDDVNEVETMAFERSPEPIDESAALSGKNSVGIDALSNPETQKTEPSTDALNDLQEPVEQADVLDSDGAGNEDELVASGESVEKASSDLEPISSEKAGGDALASEVDFDVSESALYDPEPFVADSIEDSDKEIQKTDTKTVVNSIEDEVSEPDFSALPVQENHSFPTEAEARIEELESPGEVSASKAEEPLYCISDTSVISGERSDELVSAEESSGAEIPEESLESEVQAVFDDRSDEAPIELVERPQADVETGAQSIAEDAEPLPAAPKPRQDQAPISIDNPSEPEAQATPESQIDGSIESPVIGDADEAPLTVSNQTDSPVEDAMDITIDAVNEVKREEEKDVDVGVETSENDRDSLMDGLNSIIDITSLPRSKPKRVMAKVKSGKVSRETDSKRPKKNSQKSSISARDSKSQEKKKRPSLLDSYFNGL